MKLTQLPSYLRTFLQEARQEFRHVNWPTRREAMYLTGVVIAISLGLAVFLGAFDFVFKEGLQWITGFN